jgi:hypothetical protein
VEENKERVDMIRIKDALPLRWELKGALEKKMRA